MGEQARSRGFCRGLCPITPLEPGAGRAPRADHNRSPASALFVPNPLLKGAAWQMPLKGVVSSLIAGLVGAAGTFAALLEFGAKGTPAVGVSIVFAGLPVVNVAVAIALHPPAGGLFALRGPFILGIVCRLAIVAGA